MKSTISGIVVLAIVILGIWLTQATPESPVAGGDLDRLATAELLDYQGSRVFLGDYVGKPLVINAWAVWCPFCREELPDFVTLQETFAGEITVIAIDRAESLAKAKGYTDELAISDKLVFLLDANDSFYKTIGGFSMPETIFVDETGKIVFHKRGFMRFEEMESLTRTHLIKP